MSRTVDERVLKKLRSVDGSTAWMILPRVERGEVDKALRRLKAKGLVKTKRPGSPYWQAVSV